MFNMNKKFILTFFSAGFLALAFFANAITLPTKEPGVLTLNGLFTGILAILWPIAAGICVVMLIVAGILFITANGDPGQVKKARDAVIWSVVGLVVAILAFSIISVVTNYIK